MITTGGTIASEQSASGLTPELRPMITLMFVGVLVLLIIINLRQIRNTNNTRK